ncbi:unnamed protein product [Rotaria magnacalcarata]|uniref:Uncharacterized protein n=4 Tax=Rotaria TaxID=231623 RepID=A0A815WHS0_9BILA|nr:unnamed protein product [Rotaria magnacalcarata]
MPIDWCAHPVAHLSTTKLGCRLSHPRGDRRLHAELTRHISETDGMIDETGQFLTGYHLCRTCYEKENSIYNATKSHQQNMGEDGGEVMNVDDENTENQRQLHSTTNDLSMADYQMNEKLESLTPESFTGSEDSDDSEHGYRQQQAKHILNKVFQALSITPIIDTRNTDALKRDVTRAIQGIRKLADELCHVPSTKTLKSNVTLLTTDENVSLIDGLKHLLEEFDCQWKTYVKHSYITSQQSSYIKMIKDQADEHETIVVHMDFAENHTLLAQNEITQAHWTNQQATLFTVHIKTAKEKHHSLIIISDYLAYDVEFVHTAQSIISDYVKSIYPTVKQLNYVSDGAPQHFKNNKSILNLTYHQVDFGIPVSWSFSATAHGKGAVDGIGAAVKYRTTRMVLSGTTSDAILTPEDLYKFTQSDSSMNVFYMNQKRIKNHCEKYQLLNRWNRDKPEGEYFSLTLT